jgi:hypothetical protein
MSRAVALLGQNQAACVAMEQHDAELLLERADLTRDRRLAELQRLAGMRETPCISYGLEYPQLVPVHDMSSLRRCGPPAATPCAF